MATLKTIRESYELEGTQFDDLRIAKQSAQCWRIVWRDRSGDWSVSSTSDRTKKAAHERIPAFLAGMLGASPDHVAMVNWHGDNHGYPYRATCVCGWQSRPYVSREAARAMGDDHMVSRRSTIS